MTKEETLIEYIKFLYKVIYDEEGSEGKALLTEEQREEIKQVILGNY